MPDDFNRKLLIGLLRGCYEFPPDNIDYERFPLPPRSWTVRTGDWLRQRLERLLYRFGFVRCHFPLDPPRPYLESLATNWERLARQYARLANEPSRELLLEVLRYGVMGPAHASFRLNSPAYWAGRRETGPQYLVQPDTFRVRVGHGEVALCQHRYCPPEAPGLPITVHTHPGVLHLLLGLHLYDYRAPGVRIGVAPGDIAIDGGACWGDVSLHFAHLAGEQGAVYAFEFAPENLTILRANREANPQLASRLHLVTEALWDQSGQTLNFAPNGPGTSVVAGEGASQVQTVTIDDVVAREKLPRVDFIKMDIEGAELAALRGAEQTLRRCRPKLAICAYHHHEDLFVLAEFLAGLDLGYQFYFDHYSIHREETVLFAQAPRPQGGAAAPP